MGNSVLKSIGGTVAVPSLLEETQIFSVWSMQDVRELLKRFRSHIHGFALVGAQFETIIAFKPSVAEHVDLDTLFKILDNDHDGRIDGLELLGGLALCCDATFEEKARFCFELFDFNLNSLLSKREMVMMMMSSVCGMNLLTGGGEELEPGLEVFEALVDDALLRADLNCDGQISYDEFLGWARSNRELMAGLESLKRISMQARIEIQSDDSAPETDSISSEESAILDSGDVSESESTNGSDSDFKAERGDQAMAIVPWLGQIAEPTNYKPRKRDSAGPETNLKLTWAYGYKAMGCNDTVRYLQTSNSEDRRIIYPVAAVCVIYSVKARSQTFYLGHAHEITSLALHSNQQIVATADKKSNIHVWTLDRSGQPVTLAIMQGMVKAGIQLMAFSPTGDRIATVGMDLDHTVCMHNTNTGEIISSAKGMSSPSVAYDLAFSENGSEMVLVGKNQIKFFVGINGNKRALDSVVGRIGKDGKRQSFHSATYMKADALVGCASGEIYRFRDGQCIERVQAHGVKEAVLCLYYNAAAGTLLSGGKDCLIKTWDYSLKEVGMAIDLSEDLDGDGKPDNGSLNSAVMSVQQVGNTILVGTRGCDIFEAQLPTAVGQRHSLSRIAWGHSSGELWGLAVHPSRDEFVTVGDDRTIRTWSLRSHEQTNLRVMPTAARTVAYSPSGEILCIGMIDGSIALLEATSPTLRVYSTWKHSNKTINDTKFSPDGRILAAASADTNIYLYKSDDGKAFKRLAVCRGHSGAVTHIDFSANSQYIQSNGNDHSLLYWDTSGNQVKQGFSMKDVVWATYTCVLGWAVQGIWPKSNIDYTDINACQAMPEVGDIVTGDDYHRVNLYRYPAVKKGAVHQSYVGHASHVTCVRFNWNRRFVLSTGGTDRAILVWRHEMEVCDSDHEGGDGNGYSSASAGEEQMIAYRNEHPEVAPRSVQQEAINLGWSMDEMKQFLRSSRRGKKSDEFAAVARGDQSASSAETAVVAPWKSCIVEPTEWTGSPCDSTDVDVTLAWVHGVRCHGCRNNILYSAEGSIVYNAASLAVAFHKLTGKQLFLYGPHVDEVIGIAVHPAGQIFATGEVGWKPSIVVWSSKDMNVLAKITDAHTTGVPLLAFNSKGNILASIGLDADNTLCIHDWSKSALILKTSTDKGKILSCCFLYNDTVSNQALGGASSGMTTSEAGSSGLGMPSSESDILVTGGVNFLKFWWWHGQNIQSQKAVWGGDRHEKKAAILCIASATPAVCVTGSSTGSLLVWKHCQIACNVRGSIEGNDWLLQEGDPAKLAMDNNPFVPRGGYPHRSSILAMWAVRGSIDLVSDPSEARDGYSHSARYITGDRDGVICVWRLIEAQQGGLRLILSKKCNISQFRPHPSGCVIRSLCERGGIILVGNNAGDIFEITDEQIPFVQMSTPEECFALQTALADQRKAALEAGRSSPSTTPASAPAEKAAASAAAPSAAPSDTGNNKLAAAAAAATVTVAKISTLPIEVPAQPLSVHRVSAGHSGGEVWGLCTHPILPVFFTAGDDQFLRCWSLVTHQLLSFAALPDKARAMDIRPDRPSDFAVALNNGHVYILKASLFLNPDEKESYKSSVDPMLDGRDVTPLLNLGAANAKVLRDATQWIQVVKFSFEGSYLAAGSHDTHIYVYDVAKDYALLHTLTDHTANVAHLDFGVMLRVNVPIGEPENAPEGLITKTISEKYVPDKREIESTTVTTLVTHQWETIVKDSVVASRPIKLVDVCMQSTSNALELFHWRVAEGKRNQTLKEVKDAWWASFSCPYGWSVQGIWSPSDENTEVCAVARSHQHEVVPVLATADRFGRLRLFNYPCVQPGAPDKCYKGHTGITTNVAFSFDDSYCITTGGSDHCVLVWATDVLDEIRERKALTTLAAATANMTPLVPLAGTMPGEDPSESFDEEAFRLDKIAPTIGDQFGAVKPWKGAVREPSDWKEPEDWGSAPSSSLELRFVHGYRGWDCRNNIGFADSLNEVVYHVAATGIVLNTKERKQIFNVEHDDDILCIAVHPDGHSVASGEIGKFPKIVLWDANTGMTIRTIKFHKVGVSCLAFSADGSMLVSCGMDEDRMVAVHSVQTGALLGKGKAGRGADLYCLAISSGGAFVTGGKNHVKFWELPHPNAPAGELASKSGIYTLKSVSSRTVCSCAYLGLDAVTGMSDGSLLLWKERSNTKALAAHKGPITAMASLSGGGGGGGGVSGSGGIGIGGGGGGSGMSSKGPGTRSLDGSDAGIRILTGGKDGFVHMWDLQLNRIWSLNMAESTPVSVNFQIQALSAKHSQLLIGTKGGEIYEISLIGSSDMVRHVVGHFAERAEVWGLAVHPGTQKFATAGDDMTVRLWDAKILAQVAVTKVSTKCRALAFHPDGSQLAVALFDGNVCILSDDLQRQLFSVTVASAWIQALSFSPDGSLLAAGSHDSVVYVLETKAYSCRAKLRGHHSYITALDFSHDSSKLQSTSGDYELLFWDVHRGRQICSPSDVRDEKWATQTCTLGWAVQGIWPPQADGTDINCVDRSPNGQLLATGDDWRSVKLFRNPCSKENAKSRAYKGHSEHVLRVRFSADGKFLYTVGGLDKAVMQFEVKY